MQVNKKFKTLHDLGDFLIQLGNELKQMPNIILLEEDKSQKQTEDSKGKRLKMRKKMFDEDKLNDLAARLPQMNRDEAEKSLSELTYNELKLIARKYKISGRGRKSKKALLGVILYNLYDFKAGHELLRNFSSEHP
jgi:hypothetical protein